MTLRCSSLHPSYTGNPQILQVGLFRLWAHPEPSPPSDGTSDAAGEGIWSPGKAVPSARRLGSAASLALTRIPDPHHPHTPDLFGLISTPFTSNCTLFKQNTLFKSP